MGRATSQCLSSRARGASWLLRAKGLCLRAVLSQVLRAVLSQALRAVLSQALRSHLLLLPFIPMPAQFFFQGSSDHTQLEEFIKTTILDISEAAEPAARSLSASANGGGKLEGIAADAMEYEKKLLQAQEKLRTECEFLREAELQLKDLRQVASEKVTELEQSQTALAQKRTQQLAKQLAEAGLSQYTAAELEKALEFMKASGESAPSQMAAEEKTTAQPQPPQPKAPPPELEPKNKAQKLAQMD